MNRKLLASIGFAAGLALSGLSAWASEITIAQSTDAVSLDPAFRADTATGNVQRHIHDSILFRNANSEIEPRLAQSVEQLSPKQWEIKLRSGLKFSNGELLDAHAVKFSIERLQNPELKSPIRGWWTGMTEIKIIDDLTLHITTKEVDPIFDARMTLLSPIPPKYLEEVGSEGFSLKPIGSGPYKLVEWRRDESIVLERNADYWGDKPSVEKVTFRVLPENLARVAALRTGEVDVIANVSPDQALALENADGVEVARTPSTRVMAIQFDINKAPGDNAVFREAVAYAINSDAIIQGLMRGFASPVNSILSPGIPSWPRDTDYTISHDLAKAKELIASSGLGDQEILMRAPSGRYSLDRETALAVAGQLKEAGLNIKVRPDEWGVFFGDLKNRSVSAIYLMGQGNVWLDPYPQIDAFQRTGGFLSTWEDSELDALLDKSNTVRGAERTQVFGQALERIKQTHAAVPLFALQALYGVSNKVTWQPRADEHIFAFEMEVAE